MFEGLRTFVRWADAALNADDTRDKCDATYETLKAQAEDKAEAARSSKETAQMYVSLLTSLAPTIIQILTKETPSEHVHVGRTSPPRDSERPVTVDRTEQGEQERKAPAADEQASRGAAMNAAVYEVAFRNIRKALGDLNTRVANLEAVLNKTKPIEPVGAPSLPSDPATS